MTMNVNIDALDYDNLDAIKESLIKKTMQLHLWDDNDDGEEYVGLWLEDEDREIGSTIMMHLNYDEAYYLAKGILNIIEKNKKK